jgi:hypothetical protein
MLLFFFSVGGQSNQLQSAMLIFPQSCNLTEIAGIQNRAKTFVKAVNIITK